MEAPGTWSDLIERISKRNAEDRETVKKLVREYLDHIPTENEYLRQKGEELLKAIEAI
jgi:hypothetical protein